MQGGVKIRKMIKLDIKERMKKKCEHDWANIIELATPPNSSRLLWYCAKCRKIEVSQKSSQLEGGAK